MNTIFHEVLKEGKDRGLIPDEIYINNEIDDWTIYELISSSEANAGISTTQGRIVFNSAMLELIGDNKGMAIFVIGHEVGHYVNKHRKADGLSVRYKELEADKFGGELLEKMGYDRKYGVELLKLLGEEDKDPEYPAWVDRYRAVLTGVIK